MDDMNELQMTCFEIISYVGTAKSMYINAVQKAKEGDFDAAEELIKQGDEAYNGGHDVHMGLLKKEANGERNGEAPLILLHAEDQMAGTETMRVMATELIEIHKQLQALKALSALLPPRTVRSNRQHSPFDGRRESPPPGAFVFGEGLARPIERPSALPQIKPAKTNLSLFGRFLPGERYHTGNV